MYAEEESIEARCSSNGRLEPDAAASQGMKGDGLQGQPLLSTLKSCWVLPGLYYYPGYSNSGVSMKPKDFGSVFVQALGPIEQRRC